MQRVLVANRGEIARRVFATCRELGIGTVAVFSDPDATAVFVEEADEAVALGGASPADSYLRGDAIIDAAQRTGADAIHPGYGFLAENAGFAKAVTDAGVTWIGPSPEAIEAMGSKTQARARMEAAGVPVLPGRTLQGETGEALHAIADEVGYPLLVKASAGGGGKGMRLVTDQDTLDDGVAAAQREAGSAFGDDTVFLERYAPSSRHVEIQIIGDAQSNVVALGERDCSVQRRHQKVIEESPSPVVGDDLRARMSAAAVQAGSELSYVGAGTVEFLVTADTTEFFFLEVNTRLQVEHPVTELVTGLDLVALQLSVAQGRELPSEAKAPAFTGHAIEARLYAEDPANDFLPVTGTITRFAVPDGVRVDTGVRDGSEISPHYDPMIAKVIAHGATRDDAARKLADALRRADVHGMTTNRDFLVRVLTHDEFLAGGADTSFLERHDPADLAAPLVQADDARIAAAAAALALQAARRTEAKVQSTLPSGWRNVGGDPQRVTFEPSSGDDPTEVTYRFDRYGRSLRQLTVDGEPLDAPRLHSASATEVDLEVAGLRRRHRVTTNDTAVHVNSPRGQLSLRRLPRHPDPEDHESAGTLVSPMPGAVIRIHAARGDEVVSGQPLLVLEAMKMEHEIVAPASGRLAELHVEEGTQVEAGVTLAVIETPDEEEAS